MNDKEKIEVFFNKWNEREVTLKELENMIKEMPNGMFLRIQNPTEKKYGWAKRSKDSLEIRGRR